MFVYVRAILWTLRVSESKRDSIKKERKNKPKNEKQKKAQSKAAKQYSIYAFGACEKAFIVLFWYRTAAVSSTAA